jgi:sugar phosphate isomerase/epimerase
MQTISGPGIFLAQIVRDYEPYNGIRSIGKWVSSLGFRGIQLPTWESKLFDLGKAAGSQDYCDEYKGRLLEESNIEVIELASYLQGQLVAVHPAYDTLFRSFHPPGLGAKERTEWAVDQLRNTVLASANFGTSNISVLSGGFAWPYVYPWPQRPDGLIDEAFDELVKRWMPLLNFAEEHGITFGFELHPGSDLFDGASFLKFLDKSNGHPAACLTYDPSHLHLQQLDYLEFINIFSDRIKAFHVKDAEFHSSGLMGVLGGFQPWIKRAGRFRSPGDGQIDFGRIFSILTAAGYNGWAILEWECCIKSMEQGAKEGASFIRDHIIETTQFAFDSFAEASTDKFINRQILGLNQNTE